MNWNDFWESISVFQLVGWVLGILGIIAFAIKGWPKVRAAVRLVDALGALPSFMETTTATLKKQDLTIAEIHHEVNYNNGSSVKDAVNRVELGVAGIYSRLDTADVDRKELRDDLEHTRPAVVRKRAVKKPTTKEPT